MEQWGAKDQLRCCRRWRGLGSHQGWQCQYNLDDQDDDDLDDQDDDQDDQDNIGRYHNSHHHGLIIIIMFDGQCWSSGDAEGGDCYGWKRQVSGFFVVWEFLEFNIFFRK